MGCPDVDELVAMSEGGISPERLDGIVAHVDSCATCAEVIATLGALGSADATQQVGRYQLGNVLGAGAMGVVYEAWDPQLRRKVAVKLVRPEYADAESQARMLREARALARVSHPNVVTVYEVSEAGAQICVVTELVDGETLASWQVRKSPEQIVDAWLQAARGLAAAHAVGVIHRDVKPTNVLVGRDGRVRVGDFGLARIGEDGGVVDPGGLGSPAIGATMISADGTVAGTPAYMAPEQAQGELDARADQYALCVSLVEALTGVRPSSDSSPAIDRPPGLREVVTIGLRRVPAERFATTEDLVASLAHVIRPKRRLWPFVALGGVGALVIGGVIALAVRTPTRTCEIAKVPDATWPAERRAAIASRLGATLADRVDWYLARWSDAATDVCADDRDDDALRARRTLCLDDLLEHASVELGRLGAFPSKLLAHEHVEGLPLPSTCSRNLLAHEPDPTPVQRFWSLPMRDALVRGSDATKQQLEHWWTGARAIGFTPYIVQAADLLASSEGNATSLDNMREIFHQAATLADAGPSPLAAIYANLNYVMVLADAPDRAKPLVDATRAKLTKLGGDLGLEASLDQALAMAAQSEQVERIGALQRARIAYRNAYGPNSLHEALMLLQLAAAEIQRDPHSKEAVVEWNLSAAIFETLGLDEPPPLAMPTADPQERIAQFTRFVADADAAHPGSATVSDREALLAAAYILANDDRNALDHYKRATDIREALGLRDRDYAFQLAQQAALLSGLQRSREAIVVARKALVVCGEVDAHEAKAAASSALGRALLDTGDGAAAIQPLDDAVRLGEESHDPPRLRASRQFQLARATWFVDHAKARRIAISALTTLELAVSTLGNTPLDDHYRIELADLKTRLDRWMAAHR